MGAPFDELCLATAVCSPFSALQAILTTGVAATWLSGRQKAASIAAHVAVILIVVFALLQQQQQQQQRARWYPDGLPQAQNVNWSAQDQRSSSDTILAAQ